MTFDDYVEMVLRTRDPDELVDELEITTEELIREFEDKVMLAYMAHELREEDDGV